MKTILPFECLKQALLVIAIFAGSATYSQSGPELVFTNPVLKSGIANKQGAIYRFSNVTTGVDAELKLKKFSRVDIVMDYVDRPDLGWGKALQPNFGLPGLVQPYQNWYIDFELSFYKAGTMNKQMMDTVDLTALDVDGDGNSISEYVTYDSPTSIAYSTVSYLTSTATGVLGQSFMCSECGVSSALITCSHCGGDGLTNSGSGTDNECEYCDGSGKVYQACGHAYDGGTGNTVTGPVNNFVNIDTAATQVMATYQYLKKDLIKFRYGATSGALSSNGSGIRLNSTWFRSFSLTPMTILPVKLVSFNAMLNNNKVDLTWITASEKNVSHFVIEKSTDGKNYTDAGIVFAYGNTSENVNYSFSDNNINTSVAGVTYYRLRSVDIDAKSELSNVRVIRIGKQSEQTITILTYPNPAGNELKITIPNNWQGKKVSYEVLNNNGRIIIKTEPGNSSQTETINVSSLSPGFYLARVSCNGETALQKIIKQ